MGVYAVSEGLVTITASNFDAYKKILLAHEKMMQSSSNLKQPIQTIFSIIDCSSNPENILLGDNEIKVTCDFDRSGRGSLHEVIGSYHIGSLLEMSPELKCISFSLCFDYIEEYDTEPGYLKVIKEELFDAERNTITTKIIDFFDSEGIVDMKVGALYEEKIDSVADDDDDIIIDFADESE